MWYFYFRLRTGARNRNISKKFPKICTVSMARHFEQHCFSGRDLRETLLVQKHRKGLFLTGVRRRLEQNHCLLCFMLQSNFFRRHVSHTYAKRREPERKLNTLVLPVSLGLSIIKSQLPHVQNLAQRGHKV